MKKRDQFKWPHPNIGDLHRQIGHLQNFINADQKFHSTSPTSNVGREWGVFSHILKRSLWIFQEGHRTVYFVIVGIAFSPSFFSHNFSSILNPLALYCSMLAVIFCHYMTDFKFRNPVYVDFQCALINVLFMWSICFNSNSQKCFGGGYSQHGTFFVQLLCCVVYWILKGIAALHSKGSQWHHIQCTVVPQIISLLLILKSKVSRNSCGNW